MLNTKIKNAVPNVRLSNTVSNVRTPFSKTPNMGIRNTVMNMRISSFQTAEAGTPITAGTPIGLLLSLTYASGFTPSVFYGERPNIRIKND